MTICRVGAEDRQGGYGMTWDWWKRFTKLFRGRITTLVGVDFGNGAVKVAEVSLVGGKPYLRTLAIVEAPRSMLEQEKLEEQELAIELAGLKELLTMALAQSGVKGKHAVLAVGGHFLFMREVIFPKLPPEEFAEAIKWDIPKYVPYEPDSYYFDYAVTGKAGDELRVLIVAAPKVVVGKLTQVVREAGLTPLAVDIEPLALYRTMQGVPNAMVLDVGAASTQISLFHKSNPVFTRGVQVRGDHFSSAMALAEKEDAIGEELDDFVEELAQEVRRTAQFFTQQNKQATIDKVIVTGLADCEKLVSLLRARVDLPVEGHNPLEGMAVNKSFTKPYLQQIGPQLAVAIGLALRGE
ncbi:MAG: type pilus assembly protein PilM [Firmicutes bacterium]|nr:type pilus assembly protein PilM [Bacillota bacterium]